MLPDVTQGTDFTGFHDEPEGFSEFGAISEEWINNSLIGNIHTSKPNTIHPIFFDWFLIGRRNELVANWVGYSIDYANAISRFQGVNACCHRLNSQVDGITLLFFKVDHAQGLQGISDWRTGIVLVAHYIPSCVTV